MNTLLRGLALLLGILPASMAFGSAHADDPRMNDYDVRHYDLSLNFDPARKVFSGSVTVRCVALKTVNPIVLSASSETLTIDSVSSDGKEIPFRHEGGQLVITLPADIPAKTPFEVTVRYRGISGFRGQYDDGGVFFAAANRFGTISEPWFARNWFPCKDIPSDKATSAVAATVPNGLIAVSNGLLTRTDRGDSTTTYFWETRYPIATYLISVAAAPYVEIGDTLAGAKGERMPVVYYVFPDDSAKARKDFELTTAVLGYFSTTFCEYPFIGEKFGFAEVDGDLTMENQTICSIQSSLITGTGSGKSTFIHETAHHWWGDLITPLDWHHTWLSEGFATYAEALYLEHLKGPDAYRKRIERYMDTPPGTFAGSVIGKSDTAFWDSFAPRVYEKGALVLHMLRGLVGDSTFFTIMRNYLNNPRLRYANARTEDFIDECEKASGRNLGWFFQEWVYASADSIDRPRYICRWKTEGNKPPFDVSLDIGQKDGDRMTYRMPLVVDFHAGDSVRTFNITDSLRQQTFGFSVPWKPDSLIIDKERRVLKTVEMKEIR